MNERELCGVVCLMRPNFIDILKRNEADGKVFSVTTFDGSDTIHVRVARTDKSDKSVQKDISTSATFKEFKELPRNYAKLHQMGLSSDIVPIANMLAKVALLELFRGENTAFTSLEEDLDGSFYMWANRREPEFSWYSEDSFHRSNEPAVLRWYQLQSRRRPDCMICQDMEGSAKNRDFFTSEGS